MRHQRFSERTAIDRRRNELSRAIEVERGRGLLTDLTVSNPTAAGLEYDPAELLGALGDRGALVYAPEPFGIETARRAVAESLSPAIEPSRIVLTASTSEAYAYAFKLLCDPGDDVVVPQPSYPLFEHLARFDAVNLSSYRLAYDGAWHIDLDSLRRAIGPRTRAVMLVSPNNPTGSWVSQDELSAIAELGLPIVSDEVFADYPLRASARRAPTARLAQGVLVFTLGGLSKAAGLPQMKLAWMTVSGPDALVHEALARLELIADAYLSVSAPVQHAAPRLLRAGERVRAAIRQRTRDNLAELSARLGPTAASVLDCEGGWYAVVRLPATRPEDDWILELLRHERVLVQPGWFYDFHDGPYAVVSLLTPPDALAAGARAIANAVR